jgi:glycosyltransferase involved in cell wall biosynthesis
MSGAVALPAAHEAPGKVEATPRPRPRVVLLVTLAEVGGAQAYVASLLPTLAAHFEVTVAAHGSGPLEEATRRSGARYEQLRHLCRPVRPVRDVLGLIELIALLRRERPHVLHANSSKAGVLGRLAAVVARVPIRIFTVHGWAFKAHAGVSSRLYLWADRLLRDVTTSIICVAVSELAEGLRAKTCRDDRTVVIHNGIDASASPVIRPHARPPTIVSVGRLRAPKDFVTFVRALAELEKGSFRAVIVGDGPDRGVVEHELRRLHLEGTVHLAGERGNVLELLAASDIFVLSSRSEGLPISILEAMAAGLPVIASQVGGIPELVEDGETGILVPRSNPGALAEALQLLLADEVLRKRLGSSGRVRADSRFGVDAFRSRHVELYTDLLAARGLAGAPSPVRAPSNE